MTRKQRDFLRRLIDVRMRERLDALSKSGPRPPGHASKPPPGEVVTTVIVYAVMLDALAPDFPLGDAIETFLRRVEAEQFIEDVRGDDPDLAAKLRIEERELETGGVN